MKPESLCGLGERHYSKTQLWLEVPILWILRPVTSGSTQSVHQFSILQCQMKLVLSVQATWDLLWAIRELREACLSQSTLLSSHAFYSKKESSTAESTVVLCWILDLQLTRSSPEHYRRHRCFLPLTSCMSVNCRQWCNVDITHKSIIEGQQQQQQKPIVNLHTLSTVFLSEGSKIISGNRWHLMIRTIEKSIPRKTTWNTTTLIVRTKTHIRKEIHTTDIYKVHDD